MSNDKTFDMMTAGQKMRVLSGTELDHQNSIRIDLLNAKVQDLRRTLDGSTYPSSRVVSPELQDAINAAIAEAKRLQGNTGPGGNQIIGDLLAALQAMAETVNKQIGNGSDGPFPTKGPKPAVPAAQRNNEDLKFSTYRDGSGNLHGYELAASEPSKEAPAPERVQVPRRNVMGDLLGD